MTTGIHTGPWGISLINFFRWSQYQIIALCSSSFFKGLFTNDVGIFLGLSQSSSLAYPSVLQTSNWWHHLLTDLNQKPSFLESSLFPPVLILVAYNIRGCSQMTSAFLGVSDTPWCLCQPFISFCAAPWCFKLMTSSVDGLEPKTIIFRIQLISISIDISCVAYNIT